RVAEVGGHVALGIDNDCAPGCFVSDQVGQVREALEEILVKNHVAPLCSRLVIRTLRGDADPRMGQMPHLHKSAATVAAPVQTSLINPWRAANRHARARLETPILVYMCST